VGSNVAHVRRFRCRLISTVKERKRRYDSRDACHELGEPRDTCEPLRDPFIPWRFGRQGDALSGGPDKLGARVEELKSGKDCPLVSLKVIAAFPDRIDALGWLELNPTRSQGFQKMDVP